MTLIKSESVLLPQWKSKNDLHAAQQLEQRRSPSLRTSANSTETTMTYSKESYETPNIEDMSCYSLDDFQSYSRDSQIKKPAECSGRESSESSSTFYYLLKYKESSCLKSLSICRVLNNTSYPSSLLFLVLVLLTTSNFCAASPQMRFPDEYHSDVSSYFPSPRFISDSGSHDSQLFKPEFTDSKDPHDSFIIEPYYSGETSSSPYAPISTSSHHDLKRKPLKSNNGFRFDSTRKPFWNSSRPSFDSSDDHHHWPSHAPAHAPPPSVHEIHFPDEIESPKHYSRSRLPAELAALSDHELDAFFNAIRRNSSRYARQPNNFEEGN